MSDPKSMEIDSSGGAVGVRSPSKCGKKSMIIGVIIGILVLGGAAAAVILILGSQKSSGASAEFPILKPSVEATVPDGFKAPTSSSRRRSRGRLGRRSNPTMVEEIQDRVFVSQGPSNIYSLLDIADGRVTSLNERSDGQSCLSADPVEITITGWPGETLTLWIQCYEVLNSDSFIMWGYKNGTHYLHETGTQVSYTAFMHTTAEDESDGVGQEYPCCMQVNGGGSDCMCVQSTMTCWRTGSGGTPIIEEGGNCRTTSANWPTMNATNEDRNIPNSTKAKVNMYLSVGGAYAESESGSIANIHIEASPGRATVEATFGGIGMGFCGVQFVSFDDKIRIIGSQDAPASSCYDVVDACTSGDATTELPASDCASMGFKLLPLGRQASTSHPPNQQSDSAWEASKYPSNIPLSVNFDYGVSDNTIKYAPASVPTELSADRAFNGGN